MLNQSSSTHVNVNWLIVGGGIHGVHMAARLLGETGVDPKQLKIIDPGERLLHRWRTLTETTGMRHLRSPAVHHLDLAPWSLRRFANKPSSRKQGAFAPPYDRPALTLFNGHCDMVIETFEMNTLHIQARAEGAVVGESGVDFKLSNGQSVNARNVVLAIGASEQPAYPDWTPTDDARVHHVFEPDFDGWPQSKETIAVVGGGISAAQIAIRLTKEGHRVHLVSRHGLREHQFDSDPGWLGPKFMTNFGRVQDYERRRQLITDARHKGSVPPDVYRALRRAIHSERLDWHESMIEGIDRQSEGLCMHLATGEQLQLDRVLLATGFAARRPGGPLIEQMITSGSLAVAACGYPIVDTALRWHPRIYVSGPLAELELGPVARNIAGARRAGDRVVEAVYASKEMKSRRAS